MWISVCFYFLDFYYMFFDCDVFLKCHSDTCLKTRRTNVRCIINWRDLQRYLFNFFSFILESYILFILHYMCQLYESILNSFYY